MFIRNVCTAVYLNLINVLLVLFPPALPDSSTLLKPTAPVQRLQHLTGRNQKNEKLKTKKIKKLKHKQTKPSC